MKIILEYKEFFLGIIATIITGVSLWYIQKEKYKLNFKIISSDSFPSGGYMGKYFIVILKNIGNRPVTDCKFDIQFGQGKIDTFKFSNDKLLTGVKHTDRNIDATIPLLNPKETLQLTVTSLDPMKLVYQRLLPEP